ncbi:MAG TPA: UDP-N-acetylmuramoyl-tripeptide--D-alanyl-D-alanine ligase, partial [Rudaea sp.]|nr:UDP-N-acetylmuramoyl-tripeptide--D-alanyl-D-alanine ligase [Rudaea sp.]
MNLRLTDVALWSKGALYGADIEVRGVFTDTRKPVAGGLFVALKGEHFDAHDFVAQARQGGAAAALVARPVAVDLPQVVVADTQLALGDLASAVRAQCRARVAGITGSNGKTTVKTLLASILSVCGKTHLNAGNLNNEIGLPLSILAMPEDAQFAVFEMGAGKPGDIEYLAAIARPEIAVVNNIAPAHLERMGSLEGIAETKGAIYAALPAHGTAVINADDAFADYFAGVAGTRRVLRFGIEHAADVRA